MGFYDQFETDEKRSVQAELSSLLHHYDEVDPVIRVGDWDAERDGFRVSMTAPTPTDEDLEVVSEYLAEHGYETMTENRILYVVGEQAE